MEKGLVIEVNALDDNTSSLHVCKVGEITSQEIVVCLCATLMNVTLGNGMSKEDLKSLLGGMIDEIEDAKTNFYTYLN
jgi:hypothetical protein